MAGTCLPTGSRSSRPRPTRSDMPAYRMKSTGSLIDTSPETARRMADDLEPVDPPKPEPKQRKPRRQSAQTRQ